MTQEPNLLNESEKNHKLKKENQFKKIKIILMVFVFAFLTYFAFQVLPVTLSPVEGKAKSAQELDIQVMTDGILKQSYVRNSQEVKSGDILFQFENHDLELEVLSAIQSKEIITNELAMLQKEKSLMLRRAESARVLYENGVISKRDLEGQELETAATKDRFETRAKAAEQASLILTLLEARKDMLSVKAPFDGIFLGDVEPRIDTLFKRGVKLGVLFNRKEFYFEAYITEEELNRVKVGDRAKVSFNTKRGVFVGEISEKDARVEETTVKIYRTKYVSRILIRLINPPFDLVPGLRGYVRFKPNISLMVQSEEVMK